MCGIAGIISSTPPDAARIASVSASIAHRGPDGEGCWQKDNVTLIHRRLSIVDIEHGDQPMLSACGTLALVYNGEIYNYPQLRKQLEERGCRFRTNCDTEILLHLYLIEGEEFVSRLRGMFAFAIWDDSKQQLLMARDHIGQKPLFYTQRGGSFAFASEIKALNATGIHSLQIDQECLWHHLGLRFCPGEMTLFDGVKKLRPGHLLIYRPDSQSTEIRRYWQLAYDQKSKIGLDEAVDGLQALLDETVDQHFLSDVPVGSFLSGGVDSSTVSALAARHSDVQLPTFSIGVTDGDFSELPFAREASETINSKHREFKVDADLMLLLPDIVWHMEEPGDPHAVGLYLLSQLARPHIKVVLGGDGGDEVFGGYSRFTRSNVLTAYQFVPRTLRRSLIAPLLKHLPESYSYYSLSSKANWVHEMSMLQGASRHYHAMTFFRFSDRHRRGLVSQTVQRDLENADSSRWIAEHYDSASVHDPVDRVLFAEQMTRMPEHYLLVADRMSMAHGLEMRAPLVDRNVLEFAAGLPCNYKIRGSQLKIILRTLAKRFYSKQMIDRRKLGFGFPMARWFRGPLASFVQEAVNQAAIFETGLLDATYANRLISEHQSGAIDHNFRIWNILNLEVWYRLFVLGESRDDVRYWISELLQQYAPNYSSQRTDSCHDMLSV